jgi:hypothetical protein
VNVIDLQQIAAEAGAYAPPGTPVKNNFDITKNGAIDVIDLQQVAAAATVSLWYNPPPKPTRATPVSPNPTRRRIISPTTPGGGAPHDHPRPRHARRPRQGPPQRHQARTPLA